MPHDFFSQQETKLLRSLIPYDGAPVPATFNVSPQE